MLSCALAFLAETATLVATGGVLVLGVVAYWVRLFLRDPDGTIRDCALHRLDLSTVPMALLALECKDTILVSLQC